MLQRQMQRSFMKDSNTPLLLLQWSLLPACLKSNYSRLFNSSARSPWDKQTLFRLASPLPLDGSAGLFVLYSHGLGHVINYSTEQRLLMETSQAFGGWGGWACVYTGGTTLVVRYSLSKSSLKEMCLSACWYFIFIILLFMWLWKCYIKFNK